MVTEGRPNNGRLVQLRWMTGIFMGVNLFLAGYIVGDRTTRAAVARVASRVSEIEAKQSTMGLRSIRNEDDVDELERRFNRHLEDTR